MRSAPAGGSIWFAASLAVHASRSESTSSCRIGAAGHYAFEVGVNQSAQFSQQEPQFTVHQEECSVGGASFHIGETTPDDFPPPPFPPDTSWPGVDRSRLYLHPLALFAGGRADLQPFRSIHSALLRVRPYNLNPDAMRRAHTPDPTGLLQHDGGNLWPTLQELEKRRPETLERIQQYLGFAVPGRASLALFSMESTSASHAEFQQEFPDRAYPQKLPARSMSDGTLRALGILTALLQEDASGPPSLITIEEPEMALHPAAVDILIGAMHDAGERTQVLVTTHSPELLHSDEVKADELLAVEAERGATTIGCVDEGSRRVLSDRLFTAGELLSLNQLEPDEAACETASGTLDFFDAKT